MHLCDEAPFETDFNATEVQEHVTLIMPALLSATAVKMP